MKGAEDIGYLLNKAARLSKLKVNQKLGEIGLTFPQFIVIKHLCKGEKPDTDPYLKSPASIAECIGYDRPTMTGIIDRLVKQGFVLREANPSDRRSQTIRLTEKAKKMIRVMEDFFEEVNGKTLVGFEDKEREALKEYLLRIIGNLGGKEEYMNRETENG